MPKKFLTVKEIASLFGVTPLTVRNWDKKGKLEAYRNPINNYRVYKTEDVEDLMQQIEKRSPRVATAKSSARKLKIEID